jgi:hypothetical protein
MGASGAALLAAVRPHAQQQYAQIHAAVRPCPPAAEVIWDVTRRAWQLHQLAFFGQSLLLQLRVGDVVLPWIMLREVVTRYLNPAEAQTINLGKHIYMSTESESFSFSTTATTELCACCI